MSFVSGSVKMLDVSVHRHVVFRPRNCCFSQAKVKARLLRVPNEFLSDTTLSLVSFASVTVRNGTDSWAASMSFISNKSQPHNSAM